MFSVFVTTTPEQLVISTCTNEISFFFKINFWWQCDPKNKFLITFMFKGVNGTLANRLVALNYNKRRLIIDYFFPIIDYSQCFL